MWVLWGGPAIGTDAWMGFCGGRLATCLSFTCLVVPRASAFICFAWFCMSVLYFTVKIVLVVNPLGVHITCSVSGIWLLGVF